MLLTTNIGIRLIVTTSPSRIYRKGLRSNSFSYLRYYHRKKILSAMIANSAAEGVVDMLVFCATVLRKWANTAAKTIVMAYRILP